MENSSVFVLLAGGKSERMGKAKGLLKYNNTFWILEQLNRISKTTISTIYIALGYNYQQYFNTINWFAEAQNNFIKFNGVSVKVIINPSPEKGSFSTLQTVLKSIKPVQDVMICPIDIPILNVTEFQKILENKNTIVLPNFKGKNGHPIKLNSKFCKHLLTLKTGNKDSRLDIQIKKLDAIKISKIEINDNSILKNLNTPKDWESYINKE